MIGVDVGGTFTDVGVLRRDTGELRVAKVPSTANPIDGVMSGVETAGIDLSQVALFSHGTTVATNALITRRFPPAAMVTTRVKTPGIRGGSEGPSGVYPECVAAE